MQDALSEIGRLSRLLSDAQAHIAKLQSAIKPFASFVQTNDTDTLAVTRRDDEVIATATGSWSRDAPITLGDIRELVEAAADT